MLNYNSVCTGEQVTPVLMNIPRYILLIFPRKFYVIYCILDFVHIQSILNSIKPVPCLCSKFESNPH